MQKYFAVLLFIGLCYGYGHGLNEDILNFPVLDYDDTRTYDLFWDAQNDLWRQEKNEEQKQEWDLIIQKLCENNDFTLEGRLINCENIKITPKMKKAHINKRDVPEVLEEGSGDGVPDEPKVEEKKESESVDEHFSHSQTSTIVPKESETVESKPIDSVPVKSKPETKPVEKVSVETTPVETVPIEKIPVQMAPVETVAVKIESKESAPIIGATTEQAGPLESVSEIISVVSVAHEESPQATPVVPVESVAVKIESKESAPVAGPIESVSEVTSVMSVEHEESPHAKTVVPVDPVPVETGPANSDVVKSATTAKSGNKPTESATDVKKEEKETLEKGEDKGSGSNAAEEENKNAVSSTNGRKATQEELNNLQSGVAVYNADTNMVETEEDLKNKKTNESIKTASIGGIGESTEANPGRNDNMVLITLFVAVVAVGIAAFSYNYIKRRKRNSNAQARTANGVAQSDPEEGSEMKPLMKVPEKSPNVEYKNEKQESVDA